MALFFFYFLPKKTMSPKEKGKFEDMAKQDKLRYEREMKNYIPPKGQKKKRYKDPNAPKRPPYVPQSFFFFLIRLIGGSLLKLKQKHNFPPQVCILSVLCRLSPQDKR